MTKLFLPTLLFLSTISSLFGQKIIKGQVLELASKKPIPYANIGIRNSVFGTISNEDGGFSISISAEYLKDTIIFSSLGFESQRIALSGIALSVISENQSLSILLQEEITQLKTITVSATKEKKKDYWLGNKFSNGGNIYADSVAAGSAMALLIENKYPAYHADLSFPLFIEKALLNIHSNTFDEFKIRLRILDVDSSTRLPGKDLLNETIIVKSRIKKGWLTFDLSSLNFRIDRPFFLVFEWILDDKDRIQLMNQYKLQKKLNPEKVTIDTMIVRGSKVSYYEWHNFKAGTFFGISSIKFSLDNYQSYYRNNSFGEWKRAAFILSARISLSNQSLSAKK